MEAGGKSEIEMNKKDKKIKLVRLLKPESFRTDKRLGGISVVSSTQSYLSLHHRPGFLFLISGS